VQQCIVLFEEVEMTLEVTELALYVVIGYTQEATEHYKTLTRGSYKSFFVRPCLVHPKIKNFSRFPVTSNLTAHAWSIKYK